ncbi:hypothetical protein I3760_03G164600 [Carya illinoinensis]|nr:hypothetical protein I3760_03G164600 [Carya illinoinensis]
MVGFISEPSSVDDLEQAPKLKDSNNSLDPFDPTPAEFSFFDSFPDFDSIKDWFEDTTISDMDDIGKVEFGSPEKPIELLQAQTPGGPEPIRNVSEPIAPGCEASVAGSGCGVKVEEWECEKLGNSSYCIEEEMRKKVILGSDPGNSDLGGGNDMKSKIESDGDESGSSESESENSFSSVAASSTGSGDDDDEEEEEEEKRETKVELTRGADEAGEVEEGEIRDGDDEQEMKSGTDDDGENNEADGEGMVDWSDVDEGDDDDEGGATIGPIRSTHELEVLPPVPPVDVTLQPHHQMLPMGVVLSIIGAQVIVEGVEKHNPLSEGSILWITESRTPLGLVDEIFGPVKNPYYKVRYNSDNEVPSAIHAGSSISFVPEFANHVLNDKDLYKKGYDASGANDEEVSDEAEFSDDEKEAEYKRIQKMTKRGINEPNVRNKKNNRKVKNRDGQWKNAQPSSRQPQTRVNQLASTQNQHNFSPTAAAAAAFSVGQGYVSGPGLVPPFPPTAQTVGFNTPLNGVWTNGNYGMPFQPPQGAVFPNGFPTNGMTWLPQNPHQHLMPMPNRMLFQQQFDPSQRSLPAAMLPAEQSNIFLGPTFGRGLADQNALNQVTFGMGLQGRHTQPSMNSGERGVMSNGLEVEQSCAMQQSFFTPGNVENPQQTNLGASSSRGRKPYRRGGGRFAGGRAGRQSK